MKLNYAIKFVSDMDAAVAFYRDTIGLKLGFQSPFWSEFETGETKLALHPASDENPAGSVQLGLGNFAFGELRLDLQKLRRTQKRADVVRAVR